MQGKLSASCLWQPLPWSPCTIQAGPRGAVVPLVERFAALERTMPLIVVILTSIGGIYLAGRIHPLTLPGMPR